MTTPPLPPRCGLYLASPRIGLAPKTRFDLQDVVGVTLSGVSAQRLACLDALDNPQTEGTDCRERQTTWRTHLPGPTGNSLGPRWVLGPRWDRQQGSPEPTVRQPAEASPPSPAHGPGSQDRSAPVAVALSHSTLGELHSNRSQKQPSRSGHRRMEGFLRGRFSSLRAKLNPPSCPLRKGLRWLPLYRRHRKFSQGRATAWAHSAVMKKRPPGTPQEASLQGGQCPPGAKSRPARISLESGALSSALQSLKWVSKAVTTALVTGVSRGAGDGAGAREKPGRSRSLATPLESCSSGASSADQKSDQDVRCASQQDHDSCGGGTGASAAFCACKSSTG